MSRRTATGPAVRERVTVLVLAAVVLAGGLFVNHAERAWSSTRPFESTGPAGEPVPVWPGTVTVHGARAAATLDDGYGGTLTTTGAWVAVDLSVTGGDQPLRTAAFWLEDGSGRTFDATRRVAGNYPGVAQPGSPVRTEVVFEVPRDALGEVDVHVSTLAVPQLSAVAGVPVVVDGVDPGPLSTRGPELGPAR
ncbi:DUF4352 domain-containing protein [Georgenia subflava]|uniref:DUF4352 domain-containing protein n=1 Tax=Georgenia subflava TaxID=1622177 RepID=A0A6N7EGE8_9MICO|nr:hypothetical protein [Georgenia subflava]MPV36038.1 hypothetical protein [Georgenia subflava]